MYRPFFNEMVWRKKKFKKQKHGLLYFSVCHCRKICAHEDVLRIFVKMCSRWGRKLKRKSKRVGRQWGLKMQSSLTAYYLNALLNTQYLNVELQIPSSILHPFQRGKKRWPEPHRQAPVFSNALETNQAKANSIVDKGTGPKPERHVWQCALGYLLGGVGPRGPRPHPWAQSGLRRCTSRVQVLALGLDLQREDKQISRGRVLSGARTRSYPLAALCLREAPGSLQGLLGVRTEGAGPFFLF